MKKKAGIVFSVLLVLTLFLLTPTVAMAASDTQDGIKVELTTDKSTYAAGDTVDVTVNVTNTHSFAVNNIRVTLTLPDGLNLKSGDTAVTVGTLLAGESRQLHLTATVPLENIPDVPPENIPDVPQTGGDTSMLLWIVVLLVSISGIVALLIFRKKIFSMFLCFVLVLSVMSPVAFAATTEKSFSVNETVAVAGVNKILTAKVTYGWNDPTPPNPPAPATYSVTMQDDGNGTASANPSNAAAGTQITITATPDNGYQFKQWVVISGGAVLSSTTTNPATFNMPAGNVTIKAEFEPVVVPPTQITFTAAQTGGTSNTTDSTGIVLTFSQAVTGLTANDISITDDTGAAIKGALTGSGTTWTIALTSVTAQGNVTVSAADFGNYSILTGSQTVAVYQGARHTLSVNVVTVCGSGSGSVSIQNQQASYRPGASITVTATAISPYEFLKWVTTDDLTAAAVQDGGADAGASYTFDITGDTTLYAVFSVPSANLANGLVVVNGEVTTGNQTSASGEIVIPSVVDGVAVTIAEEAFMGNTKITSVTLPEGMTRIKAGALEGCSSLASVTLPSTLKTIDLRAFSGCTSLTSITLPNSLTEIDGTAFSGSGITSIEIPASVTSIGDFAFMDCSSLKTVTFLGNQPNIGRRAFLGCSVLANIWYTAANPTGWAGIVIDVGDGNTPDNRPVVEQPSP